MNLMKTDGPSASIEYDPGIDMFMGKILGLTGASTYIAEHPRNSKMSSKIAYHLS
jgi:predicted HicB family RNase H-like nuclease